MRAVATVVRRDVLAAVTSLWPYGIAAALCSVSGLVFVASLVDGREASMRLFADPFDLLVVLVTAVMAARAFAEERRSGTAELLFTLPLSAWHVVIAKYLASVALVSGVIACTAVLPVALALTGDPDWGPVGTQYLGAFLLVVALSAVGVAVSLLSSSQALTTVLAIAVALGLWSLGPLASSLGDTVRGPLLAVSPRRHVENLNRGLLDATDVVFFLSFAAAWLTLAAQLARAEALRR